MRRYLTFVTLLIVQGCAQSGDFPSLKPRPIEAVYAKEAAAETEVVETLADDPELLTRLTDLRSRAAAQGSEFEAAIREAEQAAARAGSAGSDGWVEAQQSLSRAEASRSSLANLLAEADALMLAEAGQRRSTADRERLQAATAELQAAFEAQQRRIEEVSSRLDPP